MAARTLLLAAGLSLGAWASSAAAETEPAAFRFDSSRGSGASLGDFFGRFWPFKKKPVAPAAPGAYVRVVSWNVQAFGIHMKPARREASEAALASIFQDADAKVFAAQEISNGKGAGLLGSMLPGGEKRWSLSFQDSGDSQDNGFITQKDVHVDCDRFLFSDKAKSRHPARLAHMHVGDLDFTMITLHLTYAEGEAAASAAELRHVLDWLQAYFARPGSDPDVILAGDFNLPTRKGKAVSVRAKEARWTAIDDVLAEYPAFTGASRLIPLVDEPTSRQDGATANNYDHFIVSGDLFDEEYVAGSAGRFPVEVFQAIEASKGAKISDHFPISALLRRGGPGNDGRPIQLDGSGGCTP